MLARRHVWKEDTAYSYLGITSRLKNNFETLILIDRLLSTTQTCSPCGHREHLFLSDRTFNCVACGFEIDRDVNSAINMILFGEKTPLTNSPEDFWEVIHNERKASMQY